MYQQDTQVAEKVPPKHCPTTQEIGFRVQRYECLRRFTGGGSLSDREIYEELRGPLIRFASSLVGPEDASDLVSEVMVATLQQTTLSSLENPKAYLMQGVFNRARSQGRRRGREKEAVSRMRSDVAHSVEPADLVVGSDVVEAVASLPVQQRAAVYLVYWVDMDRSEAAELLGVRPATLRRYLFLARTKLRKWIDE